VTVSEALSRITEIRQLVSAGYPPVAQASAQTSSATTASSLLATALGGAASTATSPSSTAFAQALAAAMGATATGSATTGTAATGAAAPTAAATATPGATGVSGSDIVEAAKKYLGVPYVFGGEDASGMDCSGLVQRVLADLGISAPRVVSEQQYIGIEVASLAEAQPGDLLVTHNADHIVIYAGDGKIIHAPYPGKDVVLRDNYLTDADIQTIRRVAPAAVDVASSGTAATPVTAATVEAALASAELEPADLIAARLALLGGGTL
jgi:cell wall-associated NlpC family hydrolase